MEYQKIIFATSPAEELVMDRAWNAYGEYFPDWSREMFCDHVQKGLQGCLWEHVDTYIWKRVCDVKKEQVGKQDVS